MITLVVVVLKMMMMVVVRSDNDEDEDDDCNGNYCGGIGDDWFDEDKKTTLCTKLYYGVDLYFNQMTNDVSQMSSNNAVLEILKNI